MSNNQQSRNSFFTHGYAPVYEPLNEDPSRNVGLILQQQDTTIVHVEMPVAPVKDYLIWSIFNLAYLNFCCLGLWALVYSVKSRDRKLLGDVNASIIHGSTARNLNIAATVLSVLSFVVFIVLVVTGTLKVYQTGGH